MKIRRHAKIMELVQTHSIDTQEDLLKWLKLEGFNVTQATVSRDIKELRLVKSLTGDGKYCYSTGKAVMSDMSSKFYSLFSDSVISIDYVGNIVVVKCMVGMAQAVCAAMDSMHWEGVVGTIAGDDTIFVLVRTENDIINLTEELKKIVHGR